MTRLVLVPGVLALLPEYAGLTDPVADLRSACLEAVGWLIEDGADVRVLGSPQGQRVAASLLEVAGSRHGLAEGSPGSTTEGGGSTTEVAFLVVGNGSAKRTEKAPGHLDERAAAFDAGLGRCLRAGDVEGLRALDVALAADLWADVEGIVAMGSSVLDPGPGATMYADDPFGVAYWVMRWQTR